MPEALRPPAPPSMRMQLPSRPDVTGGMPLGDALRNGKLSEFSLPSEFRPGGEFSLDKMPLPEVPVIRPLPDAEVVDTARHELMHLKLAKLLSVPVHSVDVVKRGNVLGTTRLNTSDIGKLKIIAAGGSVHGKGDGGDRQAMAAIALRQDRNPFWDTMSTVSYARVLLAPHQDEINQVAPILAYLGYVPGRHADDMKRRVEFENKWAEANLDLATAWGQRNRKQDRMDDGKLVFQDEAEKTWKQETEREDMVPGTIEILDNGDVRIVGEKYGEVAEEILKKCPRCPGVGGVHAKDCPLTPPIEENTDMGNHPAPRERATGSITVKGKNGNVFVAIPEGVSMPTPYQDLPLAA